QHGVPIEDAGFGAGGEIGPEREEEIAGAVERDAADHVPQGGAEEDSEQGAGAGEHGVPERLPDRAFDVIAELDGYAAQDEEPEHDHQRQIESAEAGGVERGEGEEQRAAGGEQPDLIAVPDGADGAEYGAAFFVGARDQQVGDAGAEIEAIQHHVSGEHQGDEAKPGGFHKGSQAPACSGPSSISRRMRNRKRMARTVYMPMKPIR